MCASGQQTASAGTCRVFAFSGSRAGGINEGEGCGCAGEDRLRCLSELSETAWSDRGQERICLQTRRQLPDAGWEGAAGIVSSVEPEHADRQADAENVLGNLSRGGKSCRYVVISRLCWIVHPSSFEAELKGWRPVRVGRTLLSAAFDFVFDLGLNLTSILNNKSNTRVKSGGQECPPHMGSEAQHYWFGFEAYGPEFFDPLLDLIFQREDFGSGGTT